MYAEENHLPWRNLRDRDIGPIYLVYHLLGMILKQPHHICYRNNPFSSMSRGSGTLNIQLRRVLDLKQVVLCSVDTQHMVSWKNPLVALQSLSLLFQFPTSIAAYSDETDEYFGQINLIATSFTPVPQTACLNCSSSSNALKLLIRRKEERN